MSDGSRFPPILLAASLVVFFHQLTDLGWMLPGVDFATAAGRVRQLIALEGRSPGLLAADLLLLWALVARRSARGLSRAGAVHLVLGVLFVLAVPFFLVDAGQLASGFGGGQSTAFRVVVTRTLVVFASLGVGCLIAGRALRTLAGSLAGSP